MLVRPGTRAAHRTRGGKQRRPPRLRDPGAVARIPDGRPPTAEILDHLPDNHALLQTFIWQKLDRAPTFPELSRFLAFWQREIEGPLHSVRVASSALIRPAELRYANGQFTLH